MGDYGSGIGSDAHRRCQRISAEITDSLGLQGSGQALGEMEELTDRADMLVVVLVFLAVVPGWPGCLEFKIEGGAFRLRSMMVMHGRGRDVYEVNGHCHQDNQRRVKKTH